MRDRVLPTLAVGVLLLLAAGPSRAQVHQLDATPWSALADSTSRTGVVFSWDLAAGGDPGWRSQRLGLEFRVPLGESGLVFLRGHYARLETVGGSALHRWPHLLAEDASAEVIEDLELEAMLEDFGQPEVGLLSPLDLPLLGPGDGTVIVRLPFGKEELYPVVTRALVLRVEWRRRGLALGPLRLSGRAGWEVALDASSDVFTPDAYPDGPRFGADLGVPAAADRGVSVGWDARELAGGRHLRRAVAEAWTGLSGRHRLRLTVLRELGVRTHRLADWQVGISLELRRPIEPVDDEGKLPAAGRRAR